MTGDRHLKREAGADSPIPDGWEIVERTWDDRPVTKAEKRAAALDPGFKPAGDRERVVAVVDTEPMADALLAMLSGRAIHPDDRFEEGVWY